MMSDTPENPAFVRVASVSDIPTNRGKSVTVNGRALVIFRVRNQFAAVLDRCPHAGAPLSIGALRGEELTCAWHGWVFNVLDGTSIPDAPGFSLTSVPIKVEGSDIFVAA